MSNIDELYFVWDNHKAQSNLAKHSVSFEEATEVFADAYARLIPDPDHSASEERFVLLGLSGRGRVLVVVHCLRGTGTIRIISARRATHTEERSYWRFWHAQ